MSGGKKIIGLWRNHPADTDVDIDMNYGHPDADVDRSAAPADSEDARALAGQHAHMGDEMIVDKAYAAPAYPDGDSSEAYTAGYGADYAMDAPALSDSSLADPLWVRVAAPLLAFAAVAWIGFYGWTLFASDTASLTLGAWPAIIAQGAIPLILIVALYIMAQRSSQTEANRYGRMAGHMAEQSRRMENNLATYNRHLKTSREELGRQSEEIAVFGLQAAERLQEAALRIREALNDGLAASNQLTDNSSRAMVQVEGLLAGLPRIDDVAARLTENLREAGRSAHQHGSALEAQIAALNDQSERVSEVMRRQQGELKTQLAEIAEHLAIARGELENSVDTATLRFSESSEAAQTAYQAARTAADEHTTAYLAQLDDAHGQLNERGQVLMQGLLANLADAEQSVALLTQRVERQEAQAQSLTGQLINALNELDSEFATFDNKGRERLDGLARAMEALKLQTEAMTSKVQLGADGASQLIGRSEDLLLALDSVTRELEESLPSAFGRLDERLSASKQSLDLVAPELEKAEAVAEATLGRLRETDQLVTNQHRLLRETSEVGKSAADAQRATLTELQELMGSINVESDRLSEQAGPRLVEALVRVRETAMQASEKARQALTGVIPESAEKLGEASAAALSKAIGTKVDDRIADINSASERAAAVADTAAQHLLLQVTSLSAAGSALEQRIVDTKKAMEEADRDNLTRRVALLTESLNSTAIDVTKILSNEVTDTAWEAYLKGDRSVFARRAVRLIDNSEAREILRHYEEDSEFRGHVNRYIHDFEAILRNLLGTRDGSSLSVALLSSDMGKLYVMLAQAIERLRT
ncbi:hypothetical protein [Pseudonocardia sp. TMWB2A]|uniref:hypothetical protein n=1 Tax=Pseudonocardia sp. TMWB2A TaxID=687430 RepID=UPI00307E8E2D